MPANPRPRSLAEHAAELIRRQIVAGHYQLGEALSETTLASVLGVSKTPVREALQRLATQGLVVVQPQRGTFVFRMDATEVQALSEFREVLEISALRLAMRKDATTLGRLLKRIVADMAAVLDRDDAASYRELDSRYHEAIVEHSANHHLARSYGLIAFRIQALRNRLSSSPALNATSLKQHRMLANLVVRGVPAKAVTLLRRHIAKTMDDYAASAPADAPARPRRNMR